MLDSMPDGEQPEDPPRPEIPITIGVAGGSGSGKTTLVKLLLERIGHDKISYLQHDSYYYDLSELPREQRATVNFDHPNSLDTDLLIEHVNTLRKYEPVEVPIYDFSTHTRTDQVRVVQPHRIVLVEGILIFAEKGLRDLLDVRIFVDTDDDVRFIRRMQRDIRDRGRTQESVTAQWMQTVRPMHQQFVEPSRRHAHVIIPEGAYNEVAMDMLIARIHSMRRGSF